MAEELPILIGLCNPNGKFFPAPTGSRADPWPARPEKRLGISTVHRGITTTAVPEDDRNR
ncbi:MAG: hypothetical protein RL333_1045 [Pseudomonadota bacterium]|jgi:hypothetical protein